jgi:hypothetical protein
MQCECGENMYTEDPMQRIWDYLPGSIEIRQLTRYALANRPNPLVWICYGCGAWRPFRPTSQPWRGRSSE